MSARRSADETRELIRTTALRLFRERGHDATTMRVVAQEAGVAVGNAYHHFGSKDDLVQELYLEVNRTQVAQARALLQDGGDLAARLRTALHAGIDAFTPYRQFGVESVGAAIRPGSPASPFSDSSASTADLSRSLFREVVDGARPAVPAALRADLPELLWLAQVGLTVFWVHDTSPDARRTRTLVDGVAPLVGRLVSLSRLPVASGAAQDVLRLFASVRS
ncbi:TetR/AcrR family transcriptional regulator [Cellulomonas sp. S1-8]|uniref:TetR/AcrR family transcriptional regulator n=1 Tax=Cellulomonas sp. S1-8 TaxID=2904790 RepID=UPI0022434929|nr:TetR family transcriptional regulator [Cellulomonas sp. S1-8]UZN04463.1 TetR family transcriptional regulator [Cellulomonas sp. S1-8]